MRLWSKELVEKGYLPTSQLSGLWRELGSIYKKQNKHLLINYCYEYPKEILFDYSQLVIKERQKRGHKTIKWDNYDNYFNGDYAYNDTRYNEQDEEQLVTDYFNLREKKRRNQLDYTNEQFKKMHNDLRERIISWVNENMEEL